MSAESANGPSALVARVAAGAAAPSAWKVGVPASLNCFSWVIVERTSRSVSGSRAKFRCSSAPRSAVASPAWAALLMKPPIRSRSRASGVSTASPLRASVRKRLVLLAEDREHLVGLAQRGVGAIDDLGQVVAARGERGAERVEDQPEAVRVGLAHDVVDQVEVDRRAVRLQRQEVLALARLAVTDHLERGRRGECPRPAAGSACTRRTSRRAATAAGSGTTRPRGSPGTRDRRSRSTTTALPGSGSPSACAASVSLVTVTSLTAPTVAPATGPPRPGPGTRRCRRSPGPRSCRRRPRRRCR